MCVKIEEILILEHRSTYTELKSFIPGSQVLQVIRVYETCPILGCR